MPIRQITDLVAIAVGAATMIWFLFVVFTGPTSTRIPKSDSMLNLQICTGYWSLKLFWWFWPVLAVVLPVYWWLPGGDWPTRISWTLASLGAWGMLIFDGGDRELGKRLGLLVFEGLHRLAEEDDCQ